MKRLIIVGFGAAFAYALAAVTNFPALAQGDSAPNSYVKLQTATPGTAQSGHVNITGTAVAGAFQGGGAGVTGVNADLLDGLNSTAFLQSVPVPLTLIGNSNWIIQGRNAATTFLSSGIYGVSTAASGGTWGGRFESFSTGGGGGVYGVSTAATGSAYGGRFDCESTSGLAVLGWATATSGQTYGLYGRSDGTAGRGAFGVATSGTGITYGMYGESGSTDGRGVFGHATASTGNNYGVYGQSNSTTGNGVFGFAYASTGLAFGGDFESNSTSGRGLYAYAGAGTGVTYGVFAESESTNGRALYGIVNAATGTTYGLRAFNANTAGYAVYAAGDLGCSGTKSFVIDHPFDAENKYLKHYCSEGPEPLNVYTGNVVTDAKGVAWVELPNYFAEINKDFRYTLTVVDDTDSAEFVHAKVAREIRENRFKIRTSAPKVKVSWRVDAVRNDLWVRVHGAPVEVQKDEVERGKYQHPELYGQPKEMAIDYQPEVKRQSVNSPTANR